MHSRSTETHMANVLKPFVAVSISFVLASLAFLSLVHP
jgi:hypothetical protein